MRVTGIFLMIALLWGGGADAQGALPVGRVVAGQVLAADTVRGEVLKRLAEGRVADALEYWALATGQEAPAWLLATRTAYDASKQVAGACQGVAQSLHTAFTHLGGRPEFVELRNVQRLRFPYISFKMVDGRDMRLTTNGYHVVVRMGGRVYDAYTGAAGMPWAEYLSRLGTRSELTQTVGTVITEAP